MSSNTENTEAKLAAYVDGLLDPAERAEIEKYLESNPDHRKLLADLIAQREMLRGLSRESAPPDIYDAVQAQLERSILLDDSGDGTPMVIRHSRRSQLFAMAAILLLAIGLGVVLYFALPTSRPNAIEMASTALPHQPDASTQTAADENEFKAKPLELTAEESRRDSQVDRLKMADQVIAGKLVSMAGANSDSNLLASVNEEYQVLAKHLDPDIPPSQKPLVVLVSTNDPTQTSRQVADYLESNSIEWDTARTPVSYQPFSKATKVETQTVAISSEHQTLSGQADRGIAPAGTESAIGKVVAAPDEARSEDADKLGIAPQEQQHSLNYFSSLNSTSGRRVIVARGMTRQQAMALTDTLSTENSTQRARLIMNSPVQVELGTTTKDSELALRLSPVQPATTQTTQAATLPSFAQKSEAATVPETVPTTLPVAPALIAATQPTAVPVATTSPSTQPDNETLDVVILVESRPAIPATTPAAIPTTAPATAPAASQPAPATQSAE